MLVGKGHGGDEGRGLILGSNDGESDGPNDGETVGSIVGREEGAELGRADGDEVGDDVGADVSAQQRAYTPMEETTSHFGAEFIVEEPGATQYPPGQG